MNAPITVVGEALIDIVVPVVGGPVEHVGGSPANVAVGLSRLGHPTRLATYFANDPRGRRIADVMAAESVQLAAGSDTGDRTSTATALLDEAGVATYEFDLEWRLDPTPITVPTDGHLHTGSIAATLAPGSDAVLQIISTARPHSTISYDPNVRPALMGTPDDTRPRIERLIAMADVVKASDQDIHWLYGNIPITEVLERWASSGPSICAVTHGPEALLVAHAGEQRWYQPRQVAVADTVGAGDSFMAGLISGLLDAGLLGGSEARVRLQEYAWGVIQSAVDRALACAAVTVSRPGANPPNRAELEGERSG